jgi:hypothetical protein
MPPEDAYVFNDFFSKGHSFMDTFENFKYSWFLLQRNHMLISYVLP